MFALTSSLQQAKLKKTKKKKELIFKTQNFKGGVFFFFFLTFLFGGLDRSGGYGFSFNAMLWKGYRSICI